jgi:hypothetical protein
MELQSNCQIAVVLKPERGGLRIEAFGRREIVVAPYGHPLAAGMPL